MNVKELFENKELMNNIVEDIEEIPEDSKVTYEVWAFMNEHEDYTRATEILIKEFDDPDEAVSCAKSFTYESLHKKFKKAYAKDSFFTLEVETVVAIPDEDGTMNIGTIYSRDLWFDGEDSTEEDMDPVVELSTSDYTVLPDDNTLKVSCKLLKDFNKNDLVNIKFVDELESVALTYKIFSKVVYADGDYYHLEFIY